MRRILVTGGAGFIGSHFVKFALRTHADWQIVNLDKLSYAGNLDNLTDLPDPQRHEFVRGDITDHELVAKLWRDGFEVVVNFAAETHVDRSILWADDFIRTDVLGTFTLLEAARQFGVKRFVQISTDEVYGTILTGSFTEDSPLNPRNPYAASKAGADRLAFAYFVTHNVPVVITRCSNNFGPNQHPEKFIPLFITNALEDKPLPLYGDGRYVRDWIYAEDHCAAIDFLVERGQTGATYNIAGGHEVENIEIARRIVRKLGKPESLIQLVKDRPGHDRRYSLDAGRLAALGWRPQRDFPAALDTTVDWYVQNEAWWRKIKSGDFKKYYTAQYGTAVKILLTGATGFIGSHVARALVRDRHEVHALVRPQSTASRIEDIQSSLHRIEGDLFDLSFISRLKADPSVGGPQPSSFDLCLHLAWYVVPAKYLDAPENREFLKASVAFAEAMAKTGCRRFVATGTCFEYDTHLGLLSESSPTHPRSLYATCKLQLFQELQKLGSGAGMEIAWPRFFYQYGPGEDPRRFVPIAIKTLLRGETFTVPPNEQTRDYLHVADVASAVCAVACSDLTGPVNIGSGEPVTVGQIASRIAEIVGRPELIKVGTQPYAPEDSPRIIADNTRLREQTAWNRRYPLDEGLRQTIDWWKTRLAP